MPSSQGTPTLLLWSLNKWNALMFRRLNDSSMKFIDKHKEFSRKPKVCRIKFQVFEELPLLSNLFSYHLL